MRNSNSLAVNAAPAAETSQPGHGFAYRIGSTYGPAFMPVAVPTPVYSTPNWSSLPMVADRMTVAGAARQAANDGADRNPPPVPTRMSEATDLYLDERALGNENGARTLAEKRRLLNDLVAFLFANGHVTEKDPFVHEIGSRAILKYVGALSDRPGKKRYKDGRATKSALRTVDKKIRFLIDFFNCCVDPLQAVNRNPAQAQLRTAKKLKREAALEGRHYLPFTNQHFEHIFEPRRYLVVTRSPDFFWVPLLGAHLGGREGEFVNRTVGCVGFDDKLGIWFIDVPVGKNDNSIRRLPITQPLIDLGFIEYVNHVKKLGGTYLFPHRDYTAPTLVRDPSKYCCARFAALLTLCGLVDPDLVFHSFRHTVVSALHDAGVSLADAMQICGHEAQTSAIRAGVLTKKQAASVHLRTYTHSAQARASVNDPVAHHKAELERAVRLPLDYAQLRVAADIVREHVVRTPGGFQAGWAAQKKKYTDQQVAKLAIPRSAA
jgi:integrase